jgi:nitronate monooxygenase
MSQGTVALWGAQGLPIVQAPMAGVQDERLALAVCWAGGLGSLPAAMLSPSALAAQLSALQEGAGGRPYNVNFFSHSVSVSDPVGEASWRASLRADCLRWGLDPDGPLAPSSRAPFGAPAVAVLARFKPAVVSFHFGLPAPDLMAAVRAWGARIWSSATTVAEARWLAAQGVDAVIAQGLEAGGHRGMFLSEDLTTQSGTFALLPQIVRAVPVPVIAAGGIADAAGVAAVLALGAQAAQVGTAYLSCPEATTSALHRAALRSPAAAHTALTNVFTGRPARGIVNRAMREHGPLSPLAPAFPAAAAAVAPLRAAAEAAGSDEWSPLWAGQHVSSRAPMPAGDLTRVLAAELVL